MDVSWEFGDVENAILKSRGAMPRATHHNGLVRVRVPQLKFLNFCGGTTGQKS